MPATAEVEGPEPAGDRLAVAARVAMAAGVLARLWCFATQGTRSLVRDEVAVGINLFDMGPIELATRPLGQDQAAPVVFLWIEDALATLSGYDERALRLLPLAASIAALPLAHRFARDVFGPLAGLIAVALMAFSEPLIAYGVQLKPYSSDVLAALLFLNAARWALKGGETPRRCAAVGALGSVLVWASFPVVFVIGGVGLALIAGAFARGDRAAGARWIVSMAACAGSFLAGYALIFRHYATSAYLLEWWRFAFAPLPPRSAEDFRWYATNLGRMFEQELGIRHWYAAALLWALGIAATARGAFGPGGRTAAAMLLAPVALNLAASAIHKYPFNERTMLYAAPLTATLTAAGAARLLTTPRTSARLAGVAALAVALAHPIRVQAEYARNPEARALEDVRPTLAFLAEKGRPEDPIYVHWDAVAYYDFYVVRLKYLGLDRRTAIVSPRLPPRSVEEAAALYEEDVRPLREHRRVGVLLGFALPRDHRILLGILDRHGRRTDGIRASLGAAYFYDLAP
ncbi:MAG: hypothetical protein BGO49_07335 [Planctomycetales bacterium 71-10]|nr:MAG: hypothetical protein BGO49_07335 [Planctomycetales bacterium 71-10]